MVDWIMLIIGFFIGTIIQYQIRWWGKFLDFIQEHRPPEKVIHDVEIISPQKPGK